MEIVEKILTDAFVLKPRVFKDDRGYFYESFNEQVFESLTGIKANFIQDNQSYSSKGTLRGLHFQKGDAAQAKLVRVTKGSAQGLLARLYLYQASTRYDYTAGTLYAGDQSKWQDLRDICEAITGYRLLDDFGDVFVNANDNNEEVLFSTSFK